ncbi:hypothetical protein O181_028562 [Austropuccinia psidii MF-1]|uniref:Uncharacterized protein n=1 Tax=Austropuccinia psidii MF-1 TaxID=1389203 RepID=A0A9Q3H2Q1_9BASI|nr:hypothetical protein [Austropuccinia psidii MF-1]
MEDNENYAPLTLVHKEEITGHHHPYASKQERVMPVHQEKKLSMMRMSTGLQPKVKQMVNQGDKISPCMRRALRKIVSLPTLNCPPPMVFLVNQRCDRKGTRIAKLRMLINVQAGRSNKDG